jgi:hypothetical protein
MGHEEAEGHAPWTRSSKGARSMRLFKRKTPIDDAVRCPECGERLPDGAHECAMCGHDLHASGAFPTDSSECSAGVS